MLLKSDKLRKLMIVLAWIVFIGLLIKAGSLLTSFVISIHNPGASYDLYQGLDLSEIRAYSFIHYTVVVLVKASIFLLQAYLAYLMTRVLSHTNFTNPFNQGIVSSLHQLSLFALYLWFLAVIHNLHLSYLEKSTGILVSYISLGFIFLVGIAYVLAQMFQRGVEIQFENDLTI